MTDDIYCALPYDISRDQCCVYLLLTEPQPRRVSMLTVGWWPSPVAAQPVVASTA